ncbi:MAG TPA: thioredoxin family protein [Candidatus Acidoferrales bacterium]|nr:thioredoxin family protein [Candidatus Acidoferrales bacterium]
MKFFIGTFTTLFLVVAGFVPASARFYQSAAGASEVSAPSAHGAASVMNSPQLAEWESAVLSGNTEALEALYSTAPPAVTVIGKNESYDPATEPRFWAAAKSAGLASLKTKITRVDSPQPGVQRVTFELEAALHSASGTQKGFAAIALYWLEEKGKWEIVATQRTPLAQLPQPVVLLLPEPKGDDTGPDPIYPNPAEAKADIAAALAAAGRDHKRVLLDFGGNWCSDCHILDATFHYPEVARLLAPNYEVVHVNIGEYDKNLDLADKYQIPLKRGVPELAVLDAKGDLVVSQKNADFENTTKIGLQDVETFLERWKPSR